MTDIELLPQQNNNNVKLKPEKCPAAIEEEVSPLGTVGRSDTNAPDKVFQYFCLIHITKVGLLFTNL